MRLAPSLASAPLERLSEVLRDLEAAGAEMVHFDVEDGVFVPLMTLGTKVIRDLRPLTSLPFDVHLMMVNPEWLIPQLLDYGVQRLSVHYEACPYPRRTLRLIADRGVEAGLAFNPATPLPDMAYLRPHLGFVNVLTSEPEAPEAPFLPEALTKVERGKAMPGMDGVTWTVDGGFDASNVDHAVRVGADTLVVGRAAFRGGDLASNLSRLRRAVDEAGSTAGP